MEWIIGAVVFMILAKQGLKRQQKEVRIKEAVSTIAANSVLEICDLLEVEVIDTSKGSKKP
jgi:hypothetical protein